MYVHREKDFQKIHTSVNTGCEERHCRTVYLFFVYLFFLGGEGRRGRINVGGLIYQKGGKKDFVLKNTQKSEKLGHNVIQLGKQVAWEFW